MGNAIKSNGAGGPAPTVVKSLEEAAVARSLLMLTANALAGSRAELAGRLGNQYGGYRDLYGALGYPVYPTYEDYRAQFEREDIAARIVELPAVDSWKRPPALLDGPTVEEGVGDTPFVREFDALARRLRLFHYLQRADLLTGIGEYGALLMGFNHAGEGAVRLHDKLPADAAELLYVRPLSQGSATVTGLIKDPRSPLYGRPKLYTVNLGDDLGSASVHHSRIIHIVESPVDSEVYGRPRLKRVLNRLMDLQKIVGASAEALWINMDPGVQVDVNPEYTFTPEDADDLEAELEEYYHKLRRFIRTRGVTLNKLEGRDADPRGVFEVIIGLVSAATGIPQRKLLGSERGELASSQDEVNYAAVIASRQSNYCDPVILRPLVETLIRQRVIAAPESGSFTWEWPTIFEETEVERAETADKWASAAAKLAPGGNIELLVRPDEARAVLGLAPGDIAGDILDEEDLETEDLPEDLPEAALDTGAEA